jgi:signal transduction histidine kinase/Na+/proline symporter/CheY-like chemotaxis protein
MFGAPSLAEFVLVVLLYGAALFAVAWWFDRNGLKPRQARLAYPLALAVYCSSWTFFGGVGTAASAGWNYLSIYVGPALLFAFAPGFVQKIVQMSQASGSTSIADFISSRYGRSRTIASLVASFALIASIPYLALQLRSVSSSSAVLLGMKGSGLIGPIAAILLGFFAITFGARRYEVAGRNEGVLAAIALESLIKLISFVGLGLFAFFLFASAMPMTQRAGFAIFQQRFQVSGLSIEFVVRSLLSCAAMLCLPRQFYVGIIEAPDAAAVRNARMAFITYMLTISAMVIPLVLAGMTLLPASSNPDLHVLNLPLARGHPLVALLAFMGGLSAATAMVIVETIALSTMATNDLLALFILHRGVEGGEADIGRFMLNARRMIIIGIIAVAYIYSEAIDADSTLASIGLIAFAGVAQFAPALVAAVALGFNDERAAAAGLIGGLATWTWCLLLPSVAHTLFPGLHDSLSGGLLDPTRPLGLMLGSPLTNGSVLSLTINIGLMVVIHLRPHHLPHGIFKIGRRAAFGHVGAMGELRALVARFVGEAEAAEAFDHRRIGPNPAGDPSAPIDGRAARDGERLIASVIGAASARAIVTSSMAGSALEVGDVVRLLDEGGHSLQFSRALVAATLEAIDPGVSVIDRNLRLIAWNPRYLDLFEYPEGYVTVGRSIADLIRYNAERGEWGRGEIEEQVERRLEHLRRGQSHSFERRRPSGHWIKTVGRSMPGGGYVMSFTDITAEKEAQQILEARVEERTRDLARTNAELAEAKGVAEAATREKTRFLAAASHDLLQPLHAARLFCSALAEDVGEDQLSTVRKVDRAIASADGLLRALLDVSKLDAGGITPRTQLFSVGVLIDELVDEFRPLAGERGLDLIARHGRFMVETDRTLLRSILQNYLSNAVRYTAKGRIMVTARRRGGSVAIEVRDSGPGIRQEDQERIFVEFERLESLGSAGGGVGLGLAIVERIARLLGLSLSLRSELGRGSTFGVSLPIVATAAGAKADLPAAARTSTPETGIGILCLDDDPAVLAGLGAALRARQCQPLLAATAEEAIELARTAQPAIALLDYRLGSVRNGLDVAEELQLLDPALPIILITADASVADNARAAGLGIPVLSKPVDPENLWALINMRERV